MKGILEGGGVWIGLWEWGVVAHCEDTDLGWPG